MDIHGSQDVSFFPMAFRYVSRPVFYAKASVSYFSTFRFLFIFIDACLLSFTGAQLYSCAEVYDSTSYSFVEVNRFKLLSFHSGRGI